MALAVSPVSRLAASFLPAASALQSTTHSRGLVIGWIQCRLPLKAQDSAFGGVHHKFSSPRLCTTGGRLKGYLVSPMMSSSAQASVAGTPTETDIENDAATVSCEWLKSKLGDVKVLDASWYMPAEKRKPQEEYLASHIPGALFFDIDKVSCTDTDLPHMLPSASVFGQALSDLGIRQNDRVVVYDGKGIFSAPRAWWMFRIFGHEQVHVLEGGLPRWKALGYETESGQPKANKTGTEGDKKSPELDERLVREAEDVQRNINSKEADVVDARGAGRFYGTEPEPRAGIRGGHIPGSKNVPFPQVLTPEGRLKPTDELQKVFASAGVDLERPIITSCGTGVTACVLALALHKLGKKNVAVYDGSWTEWGGRKDLPVATD